MAQKMDVDGLVLDTKGFDDSLEDTFEEVGEEIQEKETNGLQGLLLNAWDVGVNLNDLGLECPEEEHVRQDNKF